MEHTWGLVCHMSRTGHSKCPRLYLHVSVQKGLCYTVEPLKFEYVKKIWGNPGT